MVRLLLPLRNVSETKELLEYLKIKSPTQATSLAIIIQLHNSLWFVSAANARNDFAEIPRNNLQSEITEQFFIYIAQILEIYWELYKGMHNTVSRGEQLSMVAEKVAFAICCSR